MRMFGLRDKADTPVHWVTLELTALELRFLRHTISYAKADQRVKGLSGERLERMEYIEKTFLKVEAHNDQLKAMEDRERP